MADAGASVFPTDTSTNSFCDPSVALLADAKAEVDLMIKQIATQSQAPASFSATFEEACRGQHLGDFIKILVEMGGIGPALMEMYSHQGDQPVVPVDFQTSHAFSQMAPVEFRCMQGELLSMQRQDAMAHGDFQSFQLQSMQGFSSNGSSPFTVDACVWSYGLSL